MAGRGRLAPGIVELGEVRHDLSRLGVIRAHGGGEDLVSFEQRRFRLGVTLQAGQAPAELSHGEAGDVVFSRQRTFYTLHRHDEKPLGLGETP